MSYWDMLPMDIKDYILYLVYIPIIQKTWRRRYNRMMISVMIARRYADEEWNESNGSYWDMNPMLKLTANEIEYCVKHANLEKNIWLWEEYIEIVQESLWEYEYVGGPGAESYKRIEIAKNILNERLLK